MADLNNILFAAPDLINSPQLALGASTGADDLTGQSLSQTQSAVALQTAVDGQVAKHGSGFWGRVWGDTGGKALQYLAKPLQEVQHDYRYIRDVYATHGFLAGLGETVGVIGAGAAGTILSGGNIGVGLLAADATAAALGRSHLFEDSFQRTADGNTYLLDGHPVSPGRDLASAIGLNLQSGVGKVVSGVGDAAFDLTTDPTLRLGGLAKAAKVGDLAETARAQEASGRVTAVTQLTQRLFPGLRIVSPEQIDQAKEAIPSYQRALTDLAGKTSAEVVESYPQLTGLAPRIGQAQTADQVHQVFRDSLGEKELLARVTTNMLPSRSLLRLPVSKLNTAIRDNFGLDANQENGIISALNPFSDGTVKGAISQKVRTFTGYLGSDVDPATLDLSSRQFNPDSPTAAKAVMSVFRYGMSNQLAKDWTQRFIDAPTLGIRKSVYAEGIVEMMKRAGLQDEPGVVADLTAKIRQTVHGGDGTYGVGHTLGDEVNNVPITAADGTQFTNRLALYGYQQGDWVLPDFRQVKNAIRDLNTVTRTYGKIDEWALSHYTNGIFKPLALVNSGFGARIAMAEAIPATFRYGALNYLRAMATSRSAKLGYTLDHTPPGPTDPVTGLKTLLDEPGHISAAASALAGGVNKLLRLPQQDQELAHDLVISQKGQIVAGAAATGHNTFLIPDEPVAKANGAAWYLPAGNKRLTERFDGDFKIYDRNDKNAQVYWHGGLSRLRNEPSAQLIARDLKDGQGKGLSPDDAASHAVLREAQRIKGLTPDGTTVAAKDDPYFFERKQLARYEDQDPETFAAHRVDDVRNHVSKPDGTLHPQVTNNLIKGQATDEDVLDGVPFDQRPVFLKGEETIPEIGDNLFQRVITQGFQRTVDPIVNHLSREPMFFLAVKEQMPALRHAVDQGIITDDEALNLARYRATQAMLPQIHNVHLRSQFAAMSANFLPFYFAQEQALRRAGYLISQNPDALRKYQILQQGLNDPGFIHTDDQGHRSLMFPGAGSVGKGFINAASAIGLPFQSGLPLSYSGDLQSLKTVLPELQPPGVSPFVALSFNTLANIFPELTGPANALEGRGAGASLQDQLIPNAFLRNVVKGLTADERDRSFANAYTQALAAAEYHDQIPPPNATPQEQQAFLDRIKNNTRSVFFLKAIIGFFSPLSPRPSSEDFGLRDEFQKSVKAKGSYSAAVDDFLTSHGDHAISYTVGKSESSTGAALNSTKPVLDFLTTNRGLLEGPQGIGAAFLAPQQQGSFDAAAYDEQVKMNLRSVRTPEQFRDAIYIQQGDRQYFADYAHHKTALEAVQGDASATSAENQAWSDYQAQFKLLNPVWAENFYSPEKTQLAARAYDQLTTLFAHGQAPASEQSQLVKGLLDDYNNHAAALAQLGSDRSAATPRKAENDAWTNYLTDLAAKDPRVTNVIRTVFRRLP